MKKSKNVFLITAVAAFSAALAATAFKSRDPKPAVPADARPIILLCLKCEHHFEMPYEAYVIAARTGRPTADTGGTRIRVENSAQHPGVELSCEACSERSAVAANYCERHDVFYPKRNADGSLGLCPSCPVPS